MRHLVKGLAVGMVTMQLLSSNAMACGMGALRLLDPTYIPKCLVKEAAESVRMIGPRTRALFDQLAFQKQLDDYFSCVEKNHAQCAADDQHHDFFVRNLLKDSNEDDRHEYARLVYDILKKNIERFESLSDEDVANLSLEVRDKLELVRVNWMSDAVRKTKSQSGEEFVASYQYRFLSESEQENSSAQKSLGWHRMF